MGAGDMTEQSNPVKQLADALHDCVEPPGRTERTERLADALQACLNEAVEAGAKRTREEWGPRFDGFETRLDRQDETLRMIWKQVKGNGKLPIDD